MRVIAGTFRSRQLKSLKGLDLRPTSDRLRETLFNVLSSRVKSARLVDAFAGTGAVGIEAISRGAGEVVFLENHPPAAKLIQTNLDFLGIRSGVRLMTADALHSLQLLADTHKSTSLAFDIVFLDPPYAASEEYRRVLNFLGNAVFLAEGSMVIAEHRSKVGLPEQFGHLRRYRVLKQGDASLSFYRFVAATPIISENE
jgi:16S rRNA (guanine966-N2)-methyltransferase